MRKHIVTHPPRLAVVGFGFWGRLCHSQLIASTPGLALAGVVSGSEAKRQAATDAYGCRTWPTFDDCLADPDVDAIVLATPNHTHADLTVRALEAGKHVVTDKVMCMNMGEFDRMAAAAEQAGRLLTVFQNRRWDGDFLTLKALVANGDLGDLRWLEAAWMNFGPWGGWRSSKSQGGGRIYDLGPHLLDQILLLFPEPVETVYCRTHYDHPGCDVESEGLIVLTFRDGRTAIADVSSLAAIPKPRLYARGTAGTFIKYGLDPQEDALRHGDIDQAAEAPENYGRLKTRDRDEAIPTLPGRWRSFYENFRDALLGQADPIVTLPQQRRLIRVFDAARQSEATGQVVRLD